MPPAHSWLRYPTEWRFRKRRGGCTCNRLLTWMQRPWRECWSSSMAIDTSTALARGVLAVAALLLLLTGCRTPGERPAPIPRARSRARRWPALGGDPARPDRTGVRAPDPSG